MVTSSVMKDVAGSGGRGAGEQEVYGANLCRIIDVG
jgi:coatomer protein complex subunit gamma